MEEENPILQRLLNQITPYNPYDGTDEMTRIFREGNIPFPVRQYEPLELQPIQIDLSNQREAIEEYAKARVDAAKRGVRANRDFADFASRRMLSSSVIPSVLQMFTGKQIQNSIDRDTQFAYQALQNLLGSQQQLDQISALSQAEAGLQTSQLQSQEDLQNQQAKQQATQFNEQQKLAHLGATTQDQQGMVQTLLNQANTEERNRSYAEYINRMYSSRSNSADLQTGRLSEALTRLTTISNLQNRLQGLTQELSRLDSDDQQTRQAAMNQLRTLYPDVAEFGFGSDAGMIAKGAAQNILGDIRQELDMNLRQYSDALSALQDPRGFPTDPLNFDVSSSDYLKRLREGLETSPIQQQPTSQQIDPSTQQPSPEAVPSQEEQPRNNIFENYQNQSQQNDESETSELNIDEIESEIQNRLSQPSEEEQIAQRRETLRKEIKEKRDRLEDIVERYGNESRVADIIERLQTELQQMNQQLTNLDKPFEKPEPSRYRPIG